MAQQSGYGIEEIYRGVIGDVINQVREAFLDEGVDIDVLQQLKRTWESKIQASGAVDLENRQPVPAPAPQTKQSRQSIPTASSSSAPSHQPHPIPADNNTPGTSSTIRVQQSSQKQMLVEQPVAATQNPIQLLSLPMPSQMLAPGSRMQLPPGLLPGTQYAIVDGPNGTQNLVLINPSQMQLNLETQAQFLLQQQQNSGSNSSAFRRPAPEIATKKEPGTGHVPQLDGGGSSSSSSFQEAKKAKKKSAKKIPQLDGGGPGMTDSSSEEEPDDDDDLKRFAGLEDESGDKVDEADDDEDEPLNSGDDQSDDEDLDTLFDADNVVVCQFEKVHRARNKWKFNLKDGLMQVNGKDYCFHKSTGEAEW